ncbi:hypothetical protein HAU32_11200 [Weissella confusa]|uniref:Uncharacterized protein n=1 Tax=Weissella fermenti TaxID=2987699 RepID=A0ABT6D7G3_9LACO|nr:MULTISPECIES: hypothetical protein [Weissella]MBJ7689504.1 hypothetical protein [Weissella confusa]MCW0925985.1 hypothetical protein [Weissella sp. LMG 11983]MDF9300465.1 hypothetical protein [Weissella sp. BK2]
MKKVILFLGLVAIIVIGSVFYFLGRDYNQTLVKDEPASSSVVSGSDVKTPDLFLEPARARTTKIFQNDLISYRFWVIF